MRLLPLLKADKFTLITFSAGFARKTHPDFFYGFVGVTLAWQFAFLVMATDPVRFRPLIIPSLFEKFSYAVAVMVLVSQGRVHKPALFFAGVDWLLGVLFVTAWFKTRATPA